MSPQTSDALTARQFAVLEAALDALLPPSGNFPKPSATDMIEGFVLKHISRPGEPVTYPGIDLDDLRALLDGLDGAADTTVALQELEEESPAHFQALWALAVFGYYSRSEVTAAIQRDLDCEYHGAPLPDGYVHVISPWDAFDPLEMPAGASGSYIATEDVRRVDLSQLAGLER